jgi:DNA-binding IclR family transcriptional regulator
VAARGSQSVERALAVLRCLAAGDDDLGVTDVATRTGLSVSTTHRLLQALRRDGLVAQDPRTERYHLGPALIALGRRAEARLPFDHLLPRLRRLADDTGESVSLGTRVGDDVLIVLHVDSPHPLRFDQVPGTFVPVHASGIGKALLAFAPDPAAEVAALGDLGAFTAATLTSADALLADLERSRARGWSLNDGERHGGVRTMAAPVRDRAGAVWAGVAIQGPTARLTDQRLEELAPLLLAAVEEMGAGVSGRG